MCRTSSFWKSYPAEGITEARFLSLRTEVCLAHCLDQLIDIGVRRSRDSRDQVSPSLDNLGVGSVLLTDTLEEFSGVSLTEILARTMFLPCRPAEWKLTR